MAQSEVERIERLAMIEMGKVAEGQVKVQRKEFPRGLLALILTLLALGVAIAQNNGASPGTHAGPSAGGPDAWKWIIDLGAPGVLGAVLTALWRYYKSQAKDHKEERKAWYEEKEELAKKHASEKADLVKDHEREKATLVKDHERERAELIKAHSTEKEKVREEEKSEKQAMRSAFEEEKSEMRELYATEVSSLREKMDADQKERREEAAALWRQNNDTTREVMSVTKDLVVALQQNSELMRLVKDTFES